MGCQQSVEALNKVRSDLQSNIAALTSRVETLSSNLSQLQRDLSSCTCNSHSSSPDPNISAQFSTLSSTHDSIVSAIDELKSSQLSLSLSLNSLKPSISQHHQSEIHQHPDLQLCISKLSELTSNDLNAENILNEFEILTEIRFDSISALCNSVKKAENLVKNPYGADGTNDWQVTVGGDGVITEDNNTFRGKSHTFVTSFGWCTLEQTITIPQGSGDRLIVVGMACSRTDNCGGEAKVFANVLGELMEVREVLPEGNWVIMKVATRIGKRKGEALVKFMGKDTVYWAGHYGPRIGYCFAYCFDL